LWLKIAGAPSGPIAQPLSYLYRAANNLMLDRYRSQQQATRRDHDWTDVATTVPGQSDEPSSERRLIAREQLRLAQARSTRSASGPPRSFAGTGSTASANARSPSNSGSA